MSFKKTITVEINGVEYEEEWELKLSFTPGEKVVMYDSNGTGHPGSPPEVELISAQLVGRTAVAHVKADVLSTLDGSAWFERAGIRTLGELGEFDSWAFEQAESDMEAAYDDACDHEMDAAREEGRPVRHIRRRK